MRIIFQIVFLLLALFLGYLLYSSIEEPIDFANERSRLDTAVETKLETIRTTQEMYRDITGMFAPNFDTLRYVLENEDFLNVRVIGDPDDPNFTGTITYDTTRTPAIDSVRALGIDLSTLADVPGTDNVKFDIAADTIEYQSTTVPVVQVGIQRAKYMGKYADIKYQRYDQRYDPNQPIKFGDLNKPSLSGNWE